MENKIRNKVRKYLIKYPLSACLLMSQDGRDFPQTRVREQPILTVSFQQERRVKTNYLPRGCTNLQDLLGHLV